jgi:hypothetical protein
MILALKVLVVGFIKKNGLASSSLICHNPAKAI